MTFEELRALGYVAAVQVDEDLEVRYIGPADRLDEVMQRLQWLAELGPTAAGWQPGHRADGRAAVQLAFREVDLPSPI